MDQSQACFSQTLEKNPTGVGHWKKRQQEKWTLGLHQVDWVDTKGSKKNKSRILKTFALHILLLFFSRLLKLKGT